MILGGFIKWGELESFSSSGADFPVIYSRSFLGKKRKIGNEKMAWIKSQAKLWPLFVVHFSPVFNLATDNIVDRDAVDLALYEDYHQATQMGATHFVVHPGRHNGDPDKALSRFLVAIKKIGGGPVVCVENQPLSGKEIGSLADVINTGYPLCLDYSHAIAEGLSPDGIVDVASELYEISNPGAPGRKRHSHLPLGNPLPLRDITIIEGGVLVENIETVWKWEHDAV